MGTFGITDFDSSNALCKDGTIDKNNPSNPCVNNGGVKPPKSKFDYSGISELLNKGGFPTNPIQKGENFSKQREIERQKILALEQAKYNSEKAMSDAQKNKTKEPIYYILVTAGVMIAGYFAYKKFKK